MSDFSIGDVAAPLVETPDALRNIAEHVACADTQSRTAFEVTSDDSG